MKGRIASTTVKAEGDCWDVWQPWTWYDADGNVIDQWYQYLYSYCETGNGDPPLGGGGSAGSGSPPDPFDCAGVLNGTAELASCGCIKGTTGIPNCSKDPCIEKTIIKNKNNIAALNNRNDTVRSKTFTGGGGKEYGYEHKVNDYPGISYNRSSAVRTDNATGTFQSEFSWNNMDGYMIGNTHSHPQPTGPNPVDVFWPLNNALNNAALTGAGPEAMSFFKENWSMTTVTPGYNYVVTVKDWDAFQALHQAHNISWYLQDYSDKANAYFADNRNATASERALYAIISQFGDAINVYKQPLGSTNYEAVQINASNHVEANPCP